MWVISALLGAWPRETRFLQYDNLTVPAAAPLTMLPGTRVGGRIVRCIDRRAFNRTVSLMLTLMLSGSPLVAKRCGEMLESYILLRAL
jgi:hypothetical protein